MFSTGMVGIMSIGLVGNAKPRNPDRNGEDGYPPGVWGEGRALGLLYRYRPARATSTQLGIAHREPKAEISLQAI